MIHGVTPVEKVLDQMVPKSGRKEWLEILSELAHHEDPTDFGCHMSSQSLKQVLDDEIDISPEFDNSSWINFIEILSFRAEYTV